MKSDNIFIPSTRYVYFDDEGNLTSIANNNNDPGNYLETTFDAVKNLIVGKEHFFQYCVLFDTIKKTYVLKHKFNEEEVAFTVEDQIFYVDRKFSKRADLKIIQDCKKKCWKFKLDKSIRDNFKNKKISFTKNLQFSITAFNEPHLLERLIVIDFLQLVEKTVEINFNSDLELDPDALSVYTIKRLDTYSHEVING